MLIEKLIRMEDNLIHRIVVVVIAIKWINVKLEYCIVIVEVNKIYNIVK